MYHYALNVRRMRSFAVMENLKMYAKALLTVMNLMSMLEDEDQWVTIDDGSALTEVGLVYGILNASSCRAFCQYELFFIIINMNWYFNIHRDGRGIDCHTQNCSTALLFGSSPSELDGGCSRIGDFKYVILLIVNGFCLFYYLIAELFI